MPLLERGALVWMEFSPHLGHEQAGRRPAIVISPRIFHERSAMAIVCPITSRIRGRSTEVVLPPGLSVSGAILVDHIRSVDRTAGYMHIAGQAPDAVVAEVSAKLAALLTAI